MNNRLKKLRQKINISQNEFANQIGIARSTLCLLEKGERILQERHIKLICQTFNVNEEWLKNGIEPIFIEKTDNLDELLDEYGLNSFSKNIFKRYLKLDKKYQEMFETFLKEIIPDENIDDDDDDDFEIIATSDDIDRIHSLKHKKAE